MLSFTASAEGERLSIDWIISEDGKGATSVPEHAWLADGTAILYDLRAPMEDRTLELLNPNNGNRSALLNAPAVVAELNARLEPEKPIEELGWPTAIDPKGQWVAYEIDGDIVAVKLRSGEIVAVADTAAEEKSPRFSPDGRTMAYVKDNDLYIWRLDARLSKRLTHGGTETLLNGTLSWVYWEEVFGRKDQGYFWSPDSRAIAYLQTDESGVDITKFVGFEPFQPEFSEQRYPTAGSTNPKIRLGVVNLQTSETTWVDLGAYPYEYLARIKWLPDGRRIAVQTLNRAQTTLDLYIADSRSGEASHLLRETDAAWINLHDDLFFLENNDQFLWLSERTGYAHLYLYDMNGQLVRQITKGEWSLRKSGGEPGMERSVSHIAEKAGWIYYTSLEKSSIERHLYRVRFDGTSREPVTREEGTHRILFQPNGNYFFDESSAIDVMPSLTIRNTVDDSVIPVWKSSGELRKRFDFLPWKLLSVAARDGFQMPAKLLFPRNFEPTKTYPVVVYVYGGPGAPSVINSWSGGPRGYFHQILANEGFIVFCVDNRSATAISKVLTSKILGRIWGPVELQDLLDGIRWLKSQPYVDNDRVGIWGWSGGGTYTMAAMTMSKEFRAGIAVAGVSDQRYYDTIYAERYMKGPKQNAGGYDAVANALRAEKLHGRLMLVTGSYDDNVHPQNTMLFVDRLVAAGILFDLMVYPGRKHGIEDDEAQRHLYTTMLEFWRRNLKPFRD